MKDATFSSARLLALYDRISDAEDAIPRLRRFVLDLAVRGKLVEQDAGDEPAAGLLTRIAKTRTLQLKERSVKKAVKLNELAPVEVPFEVPINWEWVRLNELTELVYGKLLPTSALLDEGYEVFGANGIIGRYSKYLYENPMLLISCRGAYSGTPNISPAKCFVTNNSIVCELFDPSCFNIRYLHSFLSVSSRQSIVTGTAQPQVTITNAIKLPVALPPLAEQHRIVAKVDELMALCDQLEQARAGREAVRDRLTTASLARLTAPETDAETFQSHARFALQSLPTLTTRPDQIKTLRQTILNLAVQGKLVEQDESDEPVDELLGRIAQEKARLLKGWKLKKQKPLPPIDEDEIRFNLPTGWKWARLGDLSQFVTSGSRDWAKHYANEGAIFVRMGNLSKNHYQLRLDHIQRVNPPAGGEGTRTSLEGGDVLISITGDVGMLGLIPDDFGEAYINQHTAMVRPMPDMKGRYLPELFRSPFAQDQFNAPQRGIKNSFRLTDVTQFVVPLPPLAEQHRIVAKVDALMALCDQLEASLTTTATTRSKLLNALLHEALEPAADELEAAE